jgi:hypothetical protein
MYNLLSEWQTTVVQWALQLNSIPATAETWKLKVE